MDFDTDNNGQVSSEEALEWLGHQPETDLERFITDVWTKMKDVYKPTEAEKKAMESEVLATEATPSATTSPASSETKKDEEADELEVSEDEIDDFDSDKYMQQGESGGKEEEADEEMPEYPEETKKLIEEADKIRDEFHEVDKKFRDVEENIRKTEEFTKMDLGPQGEFADLVGKCFELDDHQYVYKLCVFDRCVQKSKDGHGETSLGNWGHWSGTGPTETYTKQKYEHGQSCWNGPERSTEVKLSCGVENKLISASEPGRCEYQFEFETPAVCQDPAQSHQTSHTEL
jgi:protein kinase C substrate 80K-H